MIMIKTRATTLAFSFYKCCILDAKGIIPICFSYFQLTCYASSFTFRSAETLVFPSIHPSAPIVLLVSSPSREIYMERMQKQIPFLVLQKVAAAAAGKASCLADARVLLQLSKDKKNPWVKQNLKCVASKDKDARMGKHQRMHLGGKKSERGWNLMGKTGVCSCINSFRSALFSPENPHDATQFMCVWHFTFF